jgi:nitrous oxidase accessory protein NosD
MTVVAVGIVCVGCSGEVRDRDERIGSDGVSLKVTCGPRFVSARHGDDGSNACRARAPCASIQRAVLAACEGDVVHIARGAYAENVVVDKGLTLDADDGAVLYPALSAPAPCDDSSLCDGAASSIILVRASGVSIRGLHLDGDNPALTSGVTVGGADIDARNGIVTDHLAGKFDALEVVDVDVDNVYFRGIYASSGGTFSFRRDRVRNVRGDRSAVAIFNFGGAGAVERSVVKDSNDAISANHSTGTVFTGNRVVRSASGVHTDNAGDGAGSAADLIEDNEVEDCAADGYGAWVFVPYVPPIVRSNTVRGCSVGLAAFGQGAAVRASFLDNRVDGGGAAGSVGARVTTDQIGFGAANVAALFRHNVVRRADVGFAIEETAGFTADVAIECNRIVQNGTGIRTASAGGFVSRNRIARNGLGLASLASGVLAAERNFWGCPFGPSDPRCDGVSGNVDVDPFLTSSPACASDD